MILTYKGIYRPFSDITRGALEHAVAESGLALSTEDSDRLIQAYDALQLIQVEAGDRPSAATGVPPSPAARGDGGGGDARAHLAASRRPSAVMDDASRCVGVG